MHLRRATNSPLRRSSPRRLPRASFRSASNCAGTPHHLGSGRCRPHSIRAIDDLGQDLKPLAPYLGNNEPGRTGNAETIVITGNTLRVPTNCGERQVQLQLQPGARPSKMLREIRGTIGAYVKSDIEPVLTIEDVLRSEDKTHRARTAHASGFRRSTHRPRGYVK